MVLDIHEIADFTDFFILCSGSSLRMLDALAEAVHVKIKEHLGMTIKLEGTSNEGWMVLDIGDIVLHLFTPTQRNYYQLEKLWSSARVLLHLQ